MMKLQTLILVRQMKIFSIFILVYSLILMSSFSLTRWQWKSSKYSM